MNILLVEEAFATWVFPTVGLVLLIGATLLVALGMIADAPAALTAVTALLLLGVFAMLSPLLESGRRTRMRLALLVVMAFTWIALYAWPFGLRLFPGDPVATTPIAGAHPGERLAVGPGRFDLVLDAQLPLAAGRQNRQLHYALTLTDGTGTPHHLEGELGDRWQTRRLGRRGVAPVHLEHLSARYEVDNPTGEAFRLDGVTLAGVPNATLVATVYRHRVPPVAWLLLAGTVLILTALAFDLWWDDQRTPLAAFLTATATGAVLVFCGSAAGHAGLRQVFGAVIVGALGGVPTAALIAWLARRSPWTRATTARDHA